MLKRYWQRLRALERETRGQLLNIKEASMRFVGLASGVHTQNTHGCDRATNQTCVFTNSDLLKQRQKNARTWAHRPPRNCRGRHAFGGPTGPPTNIRFYFATGELSPKPKLDALSSQPQSLNSSLSPSIYSITPPNFKNMVHGNAQRGYQSVTNLLSCPL